MAGTVTIEREKVSHTEFLENILPKYEEVRGAIDAGNEPPFNFIYLKLDKKEVEEYVRLQQAEVTYSIMFNSNVRSNMKDVLYIHKVRMTVLDDEK